VVRARRRGRHPRSWVVGKWWARAEGWNYRGEEKGRRRQRREAGGAERRPELGGGREVEEGVGHALG
jgi:hypothetical protein